jgi:hypothetical protein
MNAASIGAMIQRGVILPAGARSSDATSLQGYRAPSARQLSFGKLQPRKPRV